MKNKLLFGLIIVILIVFAIHSLCVNSCVFLSFTIGEFLTLLIALIIGYWWVQNKNDERILDEKLISMVENLKEQIENTEYVYINPIEKKAEVLSNNRLLSNKIYILQRLSKKRNKITKYVEKIQKEFFEYERVVSENIDQKAEYFSNPLRADKQKQKMDSIEFQLDQIILEIFNVPE
ncbi:MAG: hypothetical protein PHG84_05010 [Endomicrobiaceae bacterium]|nr:hypothetical protein [Endomicrobiaceae bacterium]MDD3922529.1 hypothetical protein [Endomicrobiaceae bacterium]